MRTRDEKLSPEQRRELGALDAGVADRPVDADLAQLAALARALRDERSAPRPEFAAELDAGVAAGFQRRRATRVPPWLSRVARRLRAVPPRRLVLAAGSAGTLGIALAVALAVTGGPGEEPPRLEQQLSEGTSKQSPLQEAPSGKPRGDVIAPEPVPIPPSTGGGLRPGRAERKVERSAELTLSTDSDQVREVTDGVIGVADRYRGIVVSSQVDEGGTGEARATIELAIPSRHVQAALADLSELASVDSRSEDTVDITGPLVSARDQLARARGRLERLLRRLASAETPNETASIRARIRIARGQVATARAQLHSVERRVDLSRVGVTVLGNGDGSWTPGDALDDALDVLKVTLGVLLVAAAVLLPVAALALLAWLNLRLWRRRRRERALDA